MNKFSRDMKCRICDNDSNNKIFEIKEMMMGLKETFTYFLCSKCGALQIADITTDLKKYYPENYYSFHNTTERSSYLKLFLKKIRDEYTLYQKGKIGKFLFEIFPDTELLILSGIPKDAFILDVGCGNGRLLFRLHELGFRNARGIDPYIQEPIMYSDNLLVNKRKLTDVGGKWDVILFNHSFEHVLDPVKEIILVEKLLSDSGVCIISTPIVDSFAWDYYKTDWVQIDAPRHQHIHSKKSITILAEKANLLLNRIFYNSTEFQFLGSEQYKREIPLNDARSFFVNKDQSIFTKYDIEKFKRKSIEFNELEMGDQAVFYLKKKENKR